VLSIGNAGSGACTVQSDTGFIDCGSTCSQGFGVDTVITLEPVAATGSVFERWSGARLGMVACQVTANSMTTTIATCAFAAVRGDDNGDRKADLISRRATDGANYLCTLDVLGFKGFLNIGIRSPASWASRALPTSMMTSRLVSSGATLTARPTCGR